MTRSMAEIFTLVATCAHGHDQRLRLESRDKGWIVNLAELIDGTSQLYDKPPGLDSMVAKCGLCGAKIQRVVESAQEE